MAEEARRNGGRNEPLVSDRWRYRSKAAKKKPFGLKIFYFSRFRKTELFWTQWYETEKARDTAEIAIQKNRLSVPWRQEPYRFEHVSR